MIHVAVAVIKNPQNEILLSKRPDHVHQGGLWEFPGGKVEPGESITTALSRELEEELGVVVDACQPLISIPHQYSDKTVLLDVWEVSHFSGLPVGKEGQPLAWVKPEQLARHAGESTDFPLPLANFGIVKAIRLGDAMAISGDFQNEQDFIKRISVAIERGAALMQLRLPKLPEDTSQVLIKQALAVCRPAKVKLLLNNHFNRATVDEIDGTHLTASQLMTMETKLERPNGLLGASCHNPEELQQAVTLDLDYVTLSPVLDTRSHPKAKALGWEQFERWVREVNIPVFGLGGLNLQSLGDVKRRGGQGIAAISAYWDKQ